MNSTSRTAPRTSAPNRSAPAELDGHSPQTDPVEIVMAKVIAQALSSRPLRAPKWWYSVVLQYLQDTNLKPPSRSKFEARFSAERKRRKARRLEASAHAAAQIGSTVGDQLIELLPDVPPVNKRICELVVSSITSQGSLCLSYAWRDYMGSSRRAGEKSISKEQFHELIFSRLIIEGVPHDLMPDWWRKKLARDAR